MNRTKIAKDAMAHYDKVHANDSSEARNFYISGWLDGIQELTSLVKRMREAQMDENLLEMRLRFKIDQDEKISDKDNAEFATAMCNVVFYEDKVDEYLKKVEE